MHGHALHVAIFLYKHTIYIYPHPLQLSYLNLNLLRQQMYGYTLQVAIYFSQAYLFTYMHAFYSNTIYQITSPVSMNMVSQLPLIVTLTYLYRKSYLTATSSLHYFYLGYHIPVPFISTMTHNYNIYYQNTKPSHYFRTKSFFNISSSSLLRLVPLKHIYLLWQYMFILYIYLPWHYALELSTYVSTDI